MTSRLTLSKKDPRRTDFVLVGSANAAVTSAGYAASLNSPVYSSDTTHYARPRNGSRATTTVTRIDPSGDRLQVGVIEWPVHPLDRAQLVVGTRDVLMTKSGIFTSCVSPLFPPSRLLIGS